MNDELAALTLIDLVFDHDVPDDALEEVNALVHGVLRAFFEEEFTLEQNIAEGRANYASQRPPSAANLEKALSLIRHYNGNIAVEDIARVSADLAFPCGGGNNYQSKPGYAIDQAPTATVGAEKKPITIAWLIRSGNQNYHAKYFHRVVVLWFF